MTRHRSLFFAASLLALAASGCCCVDRVYRPTGCADGGWDPVLGSCHDCGGGGNCGGHSPCQTARHQLTCGSGCGDIYWGEWLSDPPDACDPCDGCGNWVGPRCCPSKWWQQLTCGAPGLWGWRCGTDTCCDQEGGCSSCGDGDSSVWSGTELDQYYVPGETVTEPHQAAPRAQAAPTEAKPEQTMPPKPMPELPGPQTRNSRPSPKSPSIQPTHAPRTYQQRAAANFYRPRNL